MAKPAWGRKRTCTSCGTLFYDMKKDPATCPKCGFEDKLRPLLKPRRSSAAKPAPAKPVAVANEAEEAVLPDDVEDVEVVDDEEDDLLVDDDLDDDHDDGVAGVQGQMEPRNDKE